MALRFLSLLAGLQVATAHMELSYPIPFNSKLDNTYYKNVDYTNTAPLFPSGANYPCKGYQNEGQDKIQATFEPGNSYNMTVMGSATHLGGSCQISLSYDNGASFRVIKSIIGDCPIHLTYDFTVPSDAPTSNFALFAWTWFNYEGNREMYMNCARVAIGSSNTKRSRIEGKANVKRQASTALAELPENFACNIANGCTTIEGMNVQFPNPGPVVETDPGTPNRGTGPGYTITGPTPTGNAFQSSAAPTSAAASAASTPPSSSAPSVSAGIFATATTAASASTTSSSVVSSAAIVTVATTLSSYATVTYTPTAAASTSAPTQSSSCSPLGAIICNSATTWSMCNYGGPTFMGNVAAGMQCVDGQMVLAS